jgi:serine/threonine protein kinase
MKEISKLRVIEKKLHVSIFQERDILVSLFSPFITNLQYALQDDRKLYFMMDYAPGGDIRNFMQTFKNFTEHDLSK